MSSSAPNSLTTSCQGEALICQRYNACMASLRATARRAEAGLMPPPLATAPSLLRWPLRGTRARRRLARAERREQIDHLERCLHGLAALVHAPQVGAFLGLRLVLRG